MASKRKSQRVELVLNLNDLKILREAAKTGRIAMVASLCQYKRDMENLIEAAELTDEVLDRLDVQIAKAEAAYRVAREGQQALPEPAADVAGRGEA